MSDCSQEVRKYMICTFETNSSHDVQKLIKKLRRFNLFFMHFGSKLIKSVPKGIEFGQILIIEYCFEFRLKFLKVDSG
jgi:hypothetical protein